MPAPLGGVTSITALVTTPSGGGLVPLLGFPLVLPLLAATPIPAAAAPPRIPTMALFPRPPFFTAVPVGPTFPVPRPAGAVATTSAFGPVVDTRTRNT